ncbi:hypothetical protein N7467_009734 [Penicillium canescens]|nr:hypothetical protein N7467_009734 [Penicillium canescens]
MMDCEILSSDTHQDKSEELLGQNLDRASRSALANFVPSSGSSLWHPSVRVKLGLAAGDEKVLVRSKDDAGGDAFAERENVGDLVGRNVQPCDLAARVSTGAGHRDVEFAGHLIEDRLLQLGRIMEGHFPCHGAILGRDDRDLRGFSLGNVTTTVPIDNADRAGAITDIQLIAVWQENQPIRPRDIVFVGAVRREETREPGYKMPLLLAGQVNHMDSTVDAVLEVVGAIEYYALIHAGVVREHAARPRKGQRKEALLRPAIVEHHVESKGRGIFDKVKEDGQS